jgi:hypothetical protein
LTPYSGDRISATVSYLGVFPYIAGPYSYHVSRYRFSVTDLTHPKSVTNVDSSDCLAHGCDHSTVEVSAGIPFAEYSPLASYGKVTFAMTRPAAMVEAAAANWGTGDGLLASASSSTCRRASPASKGSTALSFRGVPAR